GYFNARVWGALPSLLNYVLVGWFLGQARSGIVLLLTLVGNTTNVVLNYYFIAQWGWGAAGAGWGTSLSQLAMTVVGLIAVAPALQAIHWRKAWPDIWCKSAIASAFSLNANLMVRTFALMTTFAIFTNIGSLLNTTILAANALLLQVFVLGAYITDGLAFATESLAGILDGRGLRSSLRSLLWLSGLSGEAAGLAVALVFARFPHPLLGLLTDRPDVIETALGFVPWLIPSLALGALAFMLDGYFLGLTAGSSLRNSTVWGTVLGFLPCAGIALWQYNPHFLWLGLSTMMGVRAGVLCLRVPSTLATGN
ncbi:MAG: MATE family efflux transporter, partial [Synechococcus sp.]